MRTGIAVVILVATELGMQTKSPADAARGIVDLLLKGEYEAALANSTPQMKQAVTPARIGQVMAGLSSNGALREVRAATAASAGGYDVITIPVVYEKAAFDFVVSLDSAGKLAGLFVRPGAAPAATAESKPSKPPAEVARGIVDSLLAGDYAAVLANSTPEMKKALPEEKLREAASRLSGFGAVREILAPEVTPSAGATGVIVPVIFEKFAVNIAVTLNHAGELAGLFFQPRATPAANWTPPAYVKPDSFRAVEVTVGSGEWPLPGTLLVPAGQGPFPGVVLVHGSGPNDRDESVGGVKVFRDIAEGLASRGIAVLRYEKRTRQHAAKYAALKDATVKEETVDDAVAAAALLRERPEVNAARIFVLGHSLGGYLAPRIGRSDPKLAGMIILAGNTRPLEDLIAEQTAYLGSLQKDAAAQKQIEEMQRTVEQIRNVKPGETIMGAPAAYWLDLKGYRPAEEARNLPMPLLVLQGERDYQVTMEDFAGWKRALEGKATLKSYPSLNHLFVEGEGKSTPQEYARPAHVSELVIEDIAKWIAAH
ncbi:MAG: alpha/beta fold hydrolase [bacterium]